AVETLDYATAHLLSLWLVVLSFLVLTLIYLFNRGGAARVG
ncbi:MAG: molybdate ABC transporter permease subunit, partial [Silicimonas sp.]|nr:molybdate ABC transporter permease subunit [Silicimonas sp.]